MDTVTISDRPRRVAGVDEAGRGPLAGPLMVAAVILDPDQPIEGLADSKQLTANRREELEILILRHAFAFSVIAISIEDIDRLNIFHATMHGMATALASLACLPELALIDGNRLPKSLCCPARAIVGGDALEPAISAASILAKVARDRYMVELDSRHPGYGFAQHKGYPTSEHLNALQRLGVCPAHRRSYAPVRAILQPTLF
ncbi:MAG: ribonuclease HII [Tahibacter sp.]